MKERTLLKTALICGLLGISILFFASTLINPHETDNINLIPDDASVLIKGNIKRLADYNGTTFLTLQTDSQTDVVMFKTNNVPLRTGDLIELRGTKDKDQIIADEIRLLE